MGIEHDEATGRTKEYGSRYCLLGAISGDVIGSVYEFAAWKKHDFPLFSPSSTFTDDSVLTLAVAEAILSGRPYGDLIRQYARLYPNSGFGGLFQRWMYAADAQPYGSYGNGSAMRVSAVGWAYENPERVLAGAEASAAVTHNHPEGIKGAQATALAVYMARRGAGKETIKAELSSRFGYDLERTLDEIRPTYIFDETCQETVPQAIIAFLEATDFEDAVRNAISLGGDADTLAAISGAIAEPYFGGVPDDIVQEVRLRMPAELWDVIESFSRKYVRVGGDERME